MSGATERFGGIDAVVKNAGIQHVAQEDEFPVEKLNAILAINLTAAFYTTGLGLAHMKFMGWWPAPTSRPRWRPKHSIAGSTKTVALEVAELGITANACGITEEHVKRGVPLASVYNVFLKTVMLTTSPRALS